MKNLKYSLILLFSSICFAQVNSTTLVPACTLNFTFDATHQTSNNLANQQLGCDKWTLTVYNAGFGSFTVTLQSALANTTSTPGTFGTYTGTTATGSNPLTTTGIATFTNGTVATPWMRVVFTGTGTGVVYGVLQGSQTVISKGGGSGGGALTIAGTTNQIDVTGAGCTPANSGTCTISADTNLAAGTKGCLQVKGASLFTCAGGASTVSALPAASSNTDAVYLIKDGTTQSDCSTGGGSIYVLCNSNGSAWAAISANIGICSFSSGVLNCPGFNGTGANSGAVGFPGFTSGSVWLSARDAAGTAITYYLPNTNGTANQVLTDNGAVTCDTHTSSDAPTTCHQLIFTSSPTISGTNITNLPIGGISGLGGGVAAALAAATSGTGGICLTTGSSCSGGSGSAGATLFSTTNSTTVTATSATTLIGTVTGSTTVAANTFTAGQILEFVAQGFYSTPATPASLTIALSIGGSVRITTGAVVQIASVTSGVWRVRCAVTTRTTGASGTQIANCIFEGTGATLTPGESPMQTSSTWTIDTTATQAIDFLATWSTTTGAPTITSTNIAAWIPGAPVSSVAGLTGAVPGQGTDTKVMTAGTVSGTGATLCTDAQGGATTTGCTASGGGLVLLEEHTASGSTNLAFTAWYSTSYDNYQIEVINLIPATTNVTAEIQVSTNGGSTYDSSGTYEYSKSFVSSTVSDSGNSFANPSSFVPIWCCDLSSSSTGGVSATLKLTSPGSTTAFKYFYEQWYGLNNGGNRYSGTTGATYKSTTAINAFQVIMSSGNIASGTVRVYGLAK